MKATEWRELESWAENPDDLLCRLVHQAAVDFTAAGVIEVLMTPGDWENSVQCLGRNRNVLVSHVEGMAAAETAVAGRWLRMHAVPGLKVFRYRVVLP